MIMCVLLCYPVSIHMSQLLSTGRPISSYRRINRRVGRSLRRALATANLVPSGKQAAYKLSRT